MRVREIASSIRRGLRTAARKLSPPGNRGPLDESLHQRPGLSGGQIGSGPQPPGE
ncbi:MAG TPA: hypothetical protein VFQ71_11055 [Gaiellales bacterium]|nr:hypothetical protein [Gaiellales bacterium]